MKAISKAICSLAIMMSATAANGKDIAQKDAKNIEDAFSAFHAKNFELAIKKTDLVIERFEDGKDANSNYVCTNGMPDTLAAIIGSATEVDRGSATKTKTSAISSDICTAYFLKGFALIDLKKREQALPYLEMAVALDPDNQHYINELAEWYKTGRQWQRSLELFTAASEVTDLAVELMENKTESTRIFSATRCRSYRGIAFNHAEMKQWDQARDAIKKCLAIIPNDPKSEVELEYIKANSSGS